MTVQFQTEPILQSNVVDPPWALPAGGRLPGTGPITADGWILADDVFGQQMALRDRLIQAFPDIVHALQPEASAAAQELLHMALAVLRDRPGYVVNGRNVLRPDGITVAVDGSNPLQTLGRLVQEDFCLLQKDNAEHVMTGAILCFPASWSLAEKLGRPLTAIHQPVLDYDSNIAHRVERLFNAIRPGKPLMRSNCLLYSDANLFQPRSEKARRLQPGPSARYVRFERQCLIRLPESAAVAFSIHTTVIERNALAPLDRQLLADYHESDGSEAM